MTSLAPVAPVRLSASAAFLPLALALLSAAALAAALLFQFVGGLPPCVLCVYQRLPHFFGIVLAAGSLAVAGTRRRTLVGLAGLVWLAGAAIAGFHLGVEQHWWAGTASCGSAGGPAASLEALTAQILAAPVARCDEVPWSLFGLSMAAQNLLISIALGVAALAFALRSRNRRVDL